LISAAGFSGADAKQNWKMAMAPQFDRQGRGRLAESSSATWKFFAISRECGLYVRGDVNTLIQLDAPTKRGIAHRQRQGRPRQCDDQRPKRRATKHD